MNYATVQDVIDLARPLTAEEQTKVSKWIAIVSSALRAEASSRGKDLDEMITDNPDLAVVAKEITVRAVMSAIASFEGEASDLSQFSQSALGYTVSGTFANAGGGVYFKKAELSRLGLNIQKYGAIDIYA